VSNLLENALRHNFLHGRIDVVINHSPLGATLVIGNSGPRVSFDRLQRLTEPFQRLAPDRSTDDPGHGLGLSIVAAIAAAHDASLDIHPDHDGGLLVTVAFPSRGPSPQARLPTAKPATRAVAAVLP
jgi:signal transduction histidine kinase